MRKLVWMLLLFPAWAFAQVPISGLPAAVSLTGTEVFPVVQSGVTRKATVSLVGSALGVLTSGTLTNNGLCYYLSAGPTVPCDLVPGSGVATFLATPSSANLASAVTGETGSGALVFGTAPTLASPVTTGTAVTLTRSTSRTLANASEIIICTSTCTVTPPASATAGMQFCVQNDNNVSTVITLAAVSGVQYEVTARTSYKAANNALVSNGAVGNQICMVAVTTVLWNIFSYTGTWS